MKPHFLLPTTILAVVLAAVSPARGENGESRSPIVTASAASTEKELLLFMEEKDLVTATRRPVPIRKAPAMATVVAADEIRNMGARNLLDVLRTVPGIGISTNEWGTMMVEVRGIRTSVNEKILVMVDGHALNRNINGSALVYNIASSMPVENIRRVEVVRGPGSALYGNSAFIATVNVITRNAEEIDGVELKGGGGSFDSWKGSLVGGKEVADKLTVSGSLDHFKTDGPRLTVEADALSATPFSMAPASADLRARHSEAFLKAAWGDFSVRGQYVNQMTHNYIGLASALTGESFGQVETGWGQADYAFRLADGVSGLLKFSFDYYEQDKHAQAMLFPPGFAGSFPDGAIGKPMLKDRTLGGEFQLDWEVSKSNHLIGGLAYEAMRQCDVRQEANFNPADFSYIGPVQEVANWNRNVTRRIWAAYLQDEWQLPGGVGLTAGARYDHYSDFGSTFNPRLGMVWNFVEDADLKILYGQAFRAPNFLELYNMNNPVIVGNPALKPEKISTWEAGLSWRLHRLLTAGINGFLSDIRDQIVWDTTTAPASYANKGRSRTQGVELGLNGPSGGELSWKAVWAFQKAEDDLTGERLPYVPATRASAGIDYAPVKYVNVHADVLWTGSRPRPAGDNRPKMPDYATVDLAATLKNFYRTVELQATVRNLFNRHYSDPDTSGAAQSVPGDFPREGINAFVTASCKL
jgi:iron complex outermembrane receptor protein